MVEIRVGESWKHNPAYVGGLRALAEGRSRGFSPRDIVDVVGIEVDGVDLAGGLAEAALLDALASLVQAVRVLARADGEERVCLAGAPFELGLCRAGDALRLVLRARGDARVVREAVVEPGRFFEAVRRAARGLLDDLAAIHPALGELRVVRSLAREAARPGERRPKRPVRATAAALAEVPLGPCHLALRERPAALELRAHDGRVLWALPGGPARVLPGLAAALDGSALAGTTLDVRRGTLTLGRGPALAPSEVRRALRTLGLLTRTPLPPPAEPPGLAREGPGAGVPLNPLRLAPAPTVHAPGLTAVGLRRVMLRAAWRIDAPGPRPKLFRLGGGVLVRCAAHVELRSATGDQRWSAALHDAQPVAGTAGVVVGRDGHGQLVFLETRHGTRVARVAVALEGHLRQASSLGGAFAVTDGVRVHGLEPARREPAWSFDLGPDRTLRLASVERGLVVASDRGDVAGLDAAGVLAFRAAGVLEHLEWMAIAPAQRLAVACGLDAAGAAAAAAVRLDDGRLVWRTALDGMRPQEPLLHRGRLLVGFESKAGPALAALDLATGRLRWQGSPPGDGAVVPRAAGVRVVVARVGGGLCSYSAAGALAFQVGVQDPDAALSPVRPRPVAVGAGLVVVAAALVHVFEADDGRPVAALEPAELAPEGLVLLDGPVIVAAGRDGIVEAWRTAGHLRVVGD